MKSSTHETLAMKLWQLSPILLLGACSGTPNTDLDASTGDASQNEAGPPQGCTPTQTRCNGTCIDTSSDPKNCGGCGTACNLTDQCVASACVTCDKIDNDKDGYNACVDCNDNDPNVNPGAFEISSNGADDNCNGVTDEVIVCDMALTSTTTNATDFAHAMDMCDPWVTGASFPTVADDRAHQVAPDWGVFTVRFGSSMAALSNGIAADENDTGYVAPQQGTSFNKTGTTYPLTPGTFSCLDNNNQTQNRSDPTTVNDLTELDVSLKVPTNAHSFQIDVNYLTTDAPEWLCSQYDDQALVLLESTALKADIAMDPKGLHMSVNSPYLVLNDATSLQGTGMEVAATANQIAGGGTGWMTLSAPVTPGDTIKLRFIIFDTLDSIFDSQLLVDHFRWSTTKVCAPTSTDPLYDGGAFDAGSPDGGC